MRITTIMTSFLAISLTAGCASQVPQNLECSDGTKRRININYVKNSEIKVSPPTKSVDQGDVIEFKLNGAAGTKLEITGKSAADAWINGKRDDGSAQVFIYVCVDASQAPDDYEYLIEVDRVGTLDPVVRVRR